MSGPNWQAEQFEQNRDHLRAVAYRMLGSLPEADDAVQEAWLRFSRAGADGVDNLGGWLTTVVARICLDTLRARTAHAKSPSQISLRNRRHRNRAAPIPSAKRCLLTP